MGNCGLIQHNIFENTYGNLTMNNYFLRITAIMATCFLGSCSTKTEYTHTEGFAQGTTYHITFELKDAAKQAEVVQEIVAEFNRLDQELSNYRNDSTIEKFNATLSTEPQEISEEIVSLIEIARSVSVISQGCYDLTIKPLFDLWGFKKDSFNLPSDEALQATRALVDMNKLETLDENHIRKTVADLTIDLSSIGQGYSVARMVDILEAHGSKNYLVEIGGELKVRGKKANGDPWRIALEKPLPNERKLDKLVIFTAGEPMSLMASGSYRHYFDSDGKRYSHILDGRTGKPVAHNTVSVAVLHANPTIADAWSTALLCLGSEAGTKMANQHHIAALYIDQNGENFVETTTEAMKSIRGVDLEAANIH